MNYFYAVPTNILFIASLDFTEKIKFKIFPCKIFQESITLFKRTWDRIKVIKLF